MARLGTDRLPAGWLVGALAAGVALVMILASTPPAPGLVAASVSPPTASASASPAEMLTARPSQTPGPPRGPQPTPELVVFDHFEGAFEIVYPRSAQFQGVSLGWPGVDDPALDAVTLTGGCASDFCPLRATFSAARFEVGPVVGVDPERRIPGISLNELRAAWDATMGQETEPAERLTVDGEDALLLHSNGADAIVVIHRGWAYSIVATGIRELGNVSFLKEAARTIDFDYPVAPLSGVPMPFRDAHFAAVVPDEWKVLSDAEPVSIGMRHGLLPSWDLGWLRTLTVSSELTTLEAALAKAQEHRTVVAVATSFGGDPAWLISGPEGGQAPIALLEHGGRVFRLMVQDMEHLGIGMTDLKAFLEGFEPLP